MILGKRLNQNKQLLEDMKFKNSSKDEQIKNLQRENAELSRLRKYEDLTDEQMQKRRETLKFLDNSVKEKTDDLLYLNSQVDREKETIFNLMTKEREAVKEYLEDPLRGN